MSIQIKGIVFTPEAQIVEAIYDASIEVVAVFCAGGKKTEFHAPVADLATAAVIQTNDAIADGAGGSTEITIIDDF